MTNEEKILLLLEKQGEHLASIDSRLDKMDSRLDKMDSRLDTIDSRLDTIDSRLDTIENRLDVLEEASEITRSGVNTLLQWAEDCSETYKFPLPKVM